MLRLDDVLPARFCSAFEARLGRRVILRTWLRRERSTVADEYAFRLRYAAPAWPEAGVPAASRAETVLITDAAFRPLRYEVSAPGGIAAYVFKGETFRFNAPGESRTGSTAGMRLLLPANAVSILAIAVRMHKPWIGTLHLPFFSPESAQVIAYTLERQGRNITTNFGERIRLDHDGWIAVLAIADQNLELRSRELPWPRWHRPAPQAQAAKVTPSAPGTRKSEKKVGAARGARKAATVRRTDVQFRVGGAEVGGTLSLPAAARQLVAGVVFVGGSGAYDREGGGTISLGYGSFLDRLSAGGIAALRYDKHSPHPKGPLRYEALIRRARAALRVLRARRELQGLPLFLMGHSEGGLIALEVAVGDRNIAGLVLLAAAGRPIEEVLLEQVATQARQLRLGADWRRARQSEIRDLFRHARDTPRWTARTVPPRLLPVRRLRQWYRSIGARFPVRLIAAVKCPILIVQGLQDVQVRSRDARLLHRAARAAGLDSRLLLLEDHDHLLRRVRGAPGLATYGDRRRRVSPVVVKEVQQWIAARARAHVQSHRR